MKASSAASERSFSKAGLVVTAKRMLLKAENVDYLCLVGWGMAAQGWKEQERQRQQRKRPGKDKKKAGKGRGRPPTSSRGMRSSTALGSSGQGGGGC